MVSLSWLKPSWLDNNPYGYYRLIGFFHFQVCNPDSCIPVTCEFIFSVDRSRESCGSSRAAPRIFPAMVNDQHRSPPAEPNFIKMIDEFANVPRTILIPAEIPCQRIDHNQLGGFTSLVGNTLNHILQPPSPVGMEQIQRFIRYVKACRANSVLLTPHLDTATYTVV